MNTVMCVTALALPLLLMSTVYSAILDQDFVGARNVAFHAVLFVSSAMELFVLLGYVGVPLAFLSNCMERKECLFLKPCATQSLLDWDQGFAQFCALES